MLSVIVAMVAGVALAAVFVVSRTWLRNRLRWRGVRIVTCPENQAAVAVEVDAAQAARTATTGERVLRLAKCSRWPEKQDCGQMCLRQVEAAPEDCLARNMITRWYDGTDCALCGKRFARIEWTLHPPGVLAPDEKRVLRWDRIGLETLPDVLATHRPICWDCLVIESVVLGHPDLVTHRPPPAARV
jgi:hypothetical protein